MKKSLQLFAFLIFLTFLAVAASLGTRWMLPGGCSMCDGAGFMNPHRSPDAHQWVHDQLNLTPEQDKALHPAEEAYAQEVKRVLEEIRLANGDLGSAILKGKEETPEVQAALGKVNDAQRRLQALTLQHVFGMREVLAPAQYEKLLNLTAEALQQMDCKTE